MHMFCYSLSMTMTSRSNKSKAEVISINTPYNAEQRRIAREHSAAERRHNAQRRRKALPYVATVATAAAISLFAANVAKSPSQTQAAKELSMLNKDVKEGTPLPIDKSLMIFHEGVRYHSTPWMDDDKNAKTIAAGQVLVAKDATTVENISGTWTAFRIVENIDGADAAAGSTKELASQMVYVNTKALDQQVGQDGKPMYETIYANPMDAAANLTAYVSADGNIRLDSGEQVAVGQTMSVAESLVYAEHFQSAHS